ncbi:MAG: hypothetical protein AB7H93_07255 [Vicinamibacterales bacterium]
MIRIARDLRRAVREGAAGIERRQQKRLADLVAHARANSPFYQQLYGDLLGGHGRVDVNENALERLDPVTPWSAAVS